MQVSISLKNFDSFVITPSHTKWPVYITSYLTSQNLWVFSRARVPGAGTFVLVDDTLTPELRPSQTFNPGFCFFSYLDNPASLVSSLSIILCHQGFVLRLRNYRLSLIKKVNVSVLRSYGIKERWEFPSCLVCVPQGPFTHTTVPSLDEFRLELAPLPAY